MRLGHLAGLGWISPLPFLATLTAGTIRAQTAETWILEERFEIPDRGAPNGLAPVTDAVTLPVGRVLVRQLGRDGALTFARDGTPLPSLSAAEVEAVLGAPEAVIESERLENPDATLIYVAGESERVLRTLAVIPARDQRLEFTLGNQRYGMERPVHRGARWHATADGRLVVIADISHMGEGITGGPEPHRRGLDDRLRGRGGASCARHGRANRGRLPRVGPDVGTVHRQHRRATRPARSIPPRGTHHDRVGRSDLAASESPRHRARELGGARFRRKNAHEVRPRPVRYAPPRFGRRSRVGRSEGCRRGLASHGAGGGATLTGPALRPQVLVSLSRGPRHGYAIIRDAEDRGEGAAVPGLATLYRALTRMEGDGLIERAESDGEPTENDRRRAFRMTSWGRAVARAEASRLALLVSLARAGDLLGGAQGS